MRICKKCNLKIKTDSDICPLCQNKLICKKEENVFSSATTIEDPINDEFEKALNEWGK